MNTTNSSSNPSMEITNTEFCLQGVLLNIVGLVGLIGNILSIHILTKPQMKNSINCLLVGLASSDFLLIVTSICMFGLASAAKIETTFSLFYILKIFPYIIPYIYPIGMIAQTGSVYLTVCVSFERYIAVCWPLKASSLCTHGRAKLYVVSVVMLAFVYNIPRFFEISTIHNTTYNQTELVPTSLRTNPLYVKFYIAWMYVIFMYIIPFVSLAILNFKIYRTVRLANIERRALSNQQKRDFGLATMLMIIVIVFFLCNILALIVNILEVLGIEISELTHASNLMVTFNSSVNFFIYSIFGDKFQRVLRSTVQKKIEILRNKLFQTNPQIVELGSWCDTRNRNRILIDAPSIYVSECRLDPQGHSPTYSHSHRLSISQIRSLESGKIILNQNRKMSTPCLFDENVYYGNSMHLLVEFPNKRRMLPAYR
ncbi:FMRFamide receptor-like [Lepeophtheirus salmonis]|uniref:FMRFamide receptor-like n=1 Tax=Lepeophtheirus salmonis TaxID=72036 RepID=UPI001AE3292F|nr:FMRFamide receptor-like [Lepeophtheirus salmonis]